MEKNMEIGFITKKDCESIGTSLGDTMAYLSNLLTYKLDSDARKEAENALKSLNTVYAKFVKFDKNK